jgi:hypothetical protein
MSARDDTHESRFVSLLDDAGIQYTKEVHHGGLYYAIAQQGNVTRYENVGYHGFAAVFWFDAAGNLRAVGGYE